MEGCLGEESFQMWELNRRLEAYLARVKALEEQNELLSAELGGLRAQAGDTSWRARADDELAALRALVDQRWREKHAAEVARDNLAEEVEGVASRCQQLRLARERTAEEVARSRRAVEAEKCAQAWLSTQAAELERELEALRVAHEEERALGQARERLGHAMQGAREGRLELQQLQAERSGLQERRAALEQRLEGRWQERLRTTEQFQVRKPGAGTGQDKASGSPFGVQRPGKGSGQWGWLIWPLSLQVATYRTLLEAENSRLQTPASGSKASLSFLDPKLELHFPGTPEGRRPGPLLSVLSPTPLSSPLPGTLETPVPTFLKSQEFLQARTPTSASTPIPPTPQAPCPAVDAEIRAQDAPVSLPQPRVGRQQVPEVMWAEAKVAIPASILPGPEEPGGQQQEPSPSQSPEDHASLAPALSPDHSSLETKDGEPSASRESSRSQEEDEGQLWGLAEKETVVEAKAVSSLQQETCQEEAGLDVKEIQDAQGPLEKEALNSLEEEIQKPLIPLEKQSHETIRSLEKENLESLRSLEEENLETLKILEKENQELLKSLEGKETEVMRSLEKETLELLKPIGKEDPQTLPSLGKENQEIMRSLEVNVETFLYPGKENQELVRSLEEENAESLTLEKESQEPLRCQEVENQGTLRLLAKENQEPLRSLEEEDQETSRPLGKENHESLRAPEDENHEALRPLERDKPESLSSLEEDQEAVRPPEREDQELLRSLEKEDQEPLRSLEEDQEAVRPLEEENQELLRSLEKEKEESQRSLEDQEAMRPLEEENQEPLRSLEKEKQEAMRPPEEEKQEPLMSLEEDQEEMRALEEDQETVRPLEKEKQESLRSLEDHEAMRPLEEENQEPLRSLEKEKQEVMRPPEEEKQELLRSLEDQEAMRSLEEEGQMTLSPLEKVKPETLKSLGKDQEIVRPLEKENQELLRSLNEKSTEAVRSLETETPEPLKPTEEENLEILKPLEKESQEPLGSVEGNHETLRPPEKENQESLGSLAEWNVENLQSLEEADKGSLRHLEEEEDVEQEESQASLRPLEEQGQELPLSAQQQKWGDAIVDSGDGAELELKELDSSPGEGEVVEQGQLQLTATGEAWGPGEGQPGSPEPKEQRLPAEGAGGAGGAVGLQDPEEQPEQVGALGLPAAQGMSEVMEPELEDEDVAPGGGRASPEVTLELERAMGRSEGVERGPEQEAVKLEDPGGLAREEVMEPPLGEGGVAAKKVQGLEGPRKELEEAGTLEPESGKSRDPLETPRDWEESESGALGKTEEPVSAETLWSHEGSDTLQRRPLGSEGAEEDAKPLLGPPSLRPTESCSPSLIPEDAPGPQPLAEGNQEASWGLEGRAEVLGKAGGEQEDLGSGGIPEGLQEEGEESREESEADELGETLPDSTPLGLYLRSPASPKWDLPGEQRPSPQGEPRKEGWGPVVPASKSLGAQPSEEEEEEGAEEEERGHDSELSEEFEDLGTEASLLPGVPGDGEEPLSQVPQLLLEPAAWDRDGESDGFADEEESGEEGEEEDEEEGREPGPGHWGPAPSVGSLPALSGPQGGHLLGSETMGVSVPWDDGPRGAAADAPVTALETESQNSTEASGSEEESDAAPLETEDQVPGPLGTLSGVEDTLDGGGPGPSLKEELERVNGGVVNGLEQSEGGGQGKPGAAGGDRGSPSEEEGASLKAPWAGAPLHLGQGQFLKFSQREGDGDSWSSGED
ncbi:PREDICTED: nestin [Bison bison bison]|uniref:Nestin n=1 Tax=Bison bison bison TaxID=43346 RepID=A0A6P3H3U6_BISBB|nr:PREDICTED: nestin [Bison bison bison]